MLNQFLRTLAFLMAISAGLTAQAQTQNTLKKVAGFWQADNEGFAYNDDSAFTEIRQNGDVVENYALNYMVPYRGDLKPILNQVIGRVTVDPADQDVLHLVQKDGSQAAIRGKSANEIEVGADRFRMKMNRLAVQAVPEKQKAIVDLSAKRSQAIETYLKNLGTGRFKLKEVVLKKSDEVVERTEFKGADSDWENIRSNYKRIGLGTESQIFITSIALASKGYVLFNQNLRRLLSFQFEASKSDSPAVGFVKLNDKVSSDSSTAIKISPDVDGNSTYGEFVEISRGQTLLRLIVKNSSTDNDSSIEFVYEQMK